jgi:hypothetical protein
MPMTSIRAYRWAPSFALFLAIIGLIGVSGCQKRTALAAPPVVIVPTKPETEKAETPAPAPEAASTPEPSTTVAPTPAPAASQPSSSHRITKPADAAATPADAAAAPKSTAPQMSPVMTPADQENYERQTNERLASAEHNMLVAKGHNLDAAQRDLVEKIQTFIGQAREAAGVPDWVRANTLAQKALVLSLELVKSF